MEKHLVKIITIIIVLGLNSCLPFLWYREPKPEHFLLFDKIQKKETNTLKKPKMNGFYYYNYVDTVINIGKVYSGYYRFIDDKNVNLELSVPMGSPNSTYSFMKNAIDKNLDKAMYGYYQNNDDTVYMEYVYENREQARNTFYLSEGVFSKDYDTLFVKEQRLRKNGKKIQINRICVFYKF